MLWILPARCLKVSAKRGFMIPPGWSIAPPCPPAKSCNPKLHA